MMNRKTLIETIDIDELLSNGGIFTKIANLQDNPFEWLVSDLSKQLDEEFYLSHSGGKIISPFVARLEQLKEQEKIDDVLMRVARYVVNKFTDKWNKIYLAFIQSNYNPLENYSMIQVETPDIERNSTAKTNTELKTKTSIDSTRDTYGFNSVTSIPTNKDATDTDVDVTGDKDKNYTDIKETETGTRELTRSGNIGVTTSQQMLQSEIDLRKFNFVDMIMNDVDEIMCLSIYG